MVTYAIIGSVSVTTMFMAGFVPGILLCIVLMSMNIMLNANYEVEKVPKPTFKEVIIALKEASLALLMPIIILGGIYGGVCTPTEAAAVSCLYGFIVSVFIYKEITLKECVPILISSGITASAILFVVGASTPFQWIMSSQGIAAKMAADIVSLFSNRIVILLVINVILLFLGCFLETSAIMLLTVPVLQPIASAIGLDQIALGLIVVVNTSLGMITPPMAVCLFVAAGISKTSIEKISRKIIPFLIAELGVLAVITYFPDIVLILPRLLLGYKG
jgi:C4-dicarboxylate transporter DctM subunit